MSLVYPFAANGYVRVGAAGNSPLGGRSSPLASREVTRRPVTPIRSATTLSSAPSYVHHAVTPSKRDDPAITLVRRPVTPSKQDHTVSIADRSREVYRQATPLNKDDPALQVASKLREGTDVGIAPRKFQQPPVRLSAKVVPLTDELRPTLSHMHGVASASADATSWKRLGSSVSIATAAAIAPSGTSSTLAPAASIGESPSISRHRVSRPSLGLHHEAIRSGSGNIRSGSAKTTPTPLYQVGSAPSVQQVERAVAVESVPSFTSPSMPQVDLAVAERITPISQARHEGPVTAVESTDDVLHNLAQLRAELSDSLAQESVLEATIARKRSLAVTQASWIETLRRRTDELRRTAQDAQEQKPSSCVKTGFPRDAADMSTIPDSAGAAQNYEGCPEGDDGLENVDALHQLDDGQDEVSWDLEDAKQQLVGIKDLRYQVKCLEEEHDAKEKEILELKEQLRCLSRTIPRT